MVSSALCGAIGRVRGVDRSRKGMALTGHPRGLCPSHRSPILKSRSCGGWRPARSVDWGRSDIARRNLNRHGDTSNHHISTGPQRGREHSVHLIVENPISEMFGDYDGDQDHDLLAAVLAGFVDERDARSDHRCVLWVQDPQGHARVPYRPLLFKCLSRMLAVFTLVDHHADRYDFLAQGQRFGDRLLGQPRHTGHRDNHKGSFGCWLGWHDAYSQIHLSAFVVGVDGPEEEDKGRNGQHHYPRTLGELRDKEYRGG